MSILRVATAMALLHVVFSSTYPTLYAGALSVWTVAAAKHGTAWTHAAKAAAQRSM